MPSSREREDAAVEVEIEVEINGHNACLKNKRDAKKCYITK